MDENIKIYSTLEYSVGDKSVGRERIVFEKAEDMRQAKQDIKDNVDFEIRVPDEKFGTLIVSVSTKEISTKVYENKIILTAKDVKK